MLEELKYSLPEKVVIYLNERKVLSLSKAARLTDEFVLSHQNIFKPSQMEVPASLGTPGRLAQVAMPLRGIKEECFYCHKVGHRIANCIILKQKWDKDNSNPNSKGVVLIGSVSPPISVHTDDRQC